MEGEESDRDCGEKQQCRSKSFQSFPREIACNAVNFCSDARRHIARRPVKRNVLY